ncbi:Nuc1p [Malassezia vespertilionis]|uniref:Endonuclease n=1 Tax=Malassezia vespertilionis TaxID=2020962 RepID=A0A2N1JFH5_9BASI|nr:Nuc1p [Malassezia vespertilionis]
MSLATQAGLFGGGLVLGLYSATLLNRKQSQISVVPADAPAPSAPPALTPGTSDALAITGLPGSLTNVLRQQGFVDSYDNRLRHPLWSAEHLTAASITRKPGADGAHRSNSVFTEDMRIPPQFRATNADYFRSGYDRGHMVPAADVKSSQEAMNETFLLSNIAPQVGEGMNRDYWAHTEDFVRRLTAKFDDLYVFTLPLYLPRQGSDGKWRVSYEVIGNPPNVSVPTHFAKIVLGVGPKGTSGSMLAQIGLGSSTALGAFVIPNSMVPNSAPLRSFEMDVERAAGVTLFSPAIKSASKKLCDTVQCEIIVRDFTKANKRLAS